MIYFDNSATTKMDPSVLQTYDAVCQNIWGNSSSLHSWGEKAFNLLEQSRKQIADLMDCYPDEIYFTSGGTESDNWAIKGTAMEKRPYGKHIITSSVEHAAVMNSMKHLEKMGFDVTYLPVDDEGRVSPEDVRKAIRKDTILVSIMAINNEIGTIQPIEEAAAMIKKKNPNIVFHVDAIQAFGKMAIHPKRQGIDLLSVSGHKIHGPKGIGFLYANEKVKIKPILLGGGQQKGMRSGTDNVPGIAGMGLAAEMVYSHLSEERSRLYELRQAFIEGMQKLEGVTINGGSSETMAPHIVSVSFEGVRSEVLLHALEDQEIYVSAGSACSSNKPAISATLKSIGIKKELLESTIRFSFGAYTTMEDIHTAQNAIQTLLPMLRKYWRKK